MKIWGTFSIPAYRDFESFILCIVFHMTLPLLPIILELLFTRTISAKSLTIAAAMYSISIGISSKNFIVFGLTVATSIIFAAFFGFVSGLPATAISQFQNSIDVSKWSYLTIISIFALHSVERIIRHFWWHEVFPPFIENWRGD